MAGLVAHCTAGFTPVQAATAALTFASYNVAYILMIKTNHRSQFYGTPLVSLCCNLSWELLVSLLFPSRYNCYAAANGMWLVFNAVILYQTFLYGPREWARSGGGGAAVHFRSLAACTLAACAALMYLLMKQIGDDSNEGAYTSWALALLEPALALSMLHHRRSSRGQSLAAATLKLVSHVSGAAVSYLVSPKPNGADLSTPLFIYLYFLCCALPVVFIAALRRQQALEAQQAGERRAKHE